MSCLFTPARAARQDFASLTHTGKELLVLPTPVHPDPADDHHSVSRITLRQVLLGGMEDAVRFDATYERYERDPDGTVTRWAFRTFLSTARHFPALQARMA
uniref:hypothetical protein n=1 Tax=Nonomuraea pusilla TaxID=46177 RepID=UPI00191BF0D9|nr:hypothetical protein [Nonomuraea pusilla]